MATPFKTIGGYEVLNGDLLGEGTFGWVYKAKHLDDNQEVAAKMLKKYEPSLNNPTVQRDIESLDKIPKHKNLVSILYHEAVNGEYWIFMELCDLGDLPEYFQKNKPDMSFKLHVMVETMTGLNFLHEKDIIHRDLKPQNILLQSQNGYPLPTVKITDFGLSKFLSEGQSSLMHTEVGTRAFQAPEMFEKDARTGKPNYRRSVDIFAMGLVFLAILQSKGGENEHMIPRAEDSVQSEGEVNRKGVGEAMYMRSNIQPEIRVAVINNRDDEIVKNIKKLINQMTLIIHQRRPKAAVVLKLLEKLQMIHKASVNQKSTPSGETVVEYSRTGTQ